MKEAPVVDEDHVVRHGIQAVSVLGGQLGNNIQSLVLVVGKFWVNGSPRWLRSGGVEAETSWVNTEDDFALVDLKKRGQRETRRIGRPSVKC